MRITFLSLLLTVVAAPSLVAQEAAPPPPSPWATSIGAGVALTSGNSDTQNLNVAFNTAWDPKSGRTFKGDLLYLRGQSDGETTLDKVSAGARYDRSLSERTFLFTEVTGLHDSLKRIDYFLSPLAGAGWFALKDGTQALRFDGAAGAVVEKNDILGSSTSGAIKAGESWERKLSATSGLTQQLSGIWKTDDWDDASYHFAAGLTSSITAASELKLSYVYDYRNKVASPDIEKGDSALVASLLFKF